MFKFIKKWLSDYHEINAWYASQGIHIIHTPYGVVQYMDDAAIKRLNTVHDKSNAISKQD